MSIQFRLIEIMLAIKKNGCLSKAAEELYISQPALTQYIQRAESELGYPLLIRDKRTCSFTPPGQVLVERGAVFLKYRDELLRDMNAANEKDHNTIRLGMANGYTRTYLSALLTELSISAPDVHVIPYEEYTLRMVEQLHTGELDMILMPIPPKDPSLSSCLIRKEHILAAVNPTCPANHYAFVEDGKKMINLVSLKTMPFINLKGASLFTNFYNIFFQEAGYEPNAIFSADNWITCDDMVNANMGFTLVPDSIASSSKNSNCYYHIKSAYPTYRFVTLSYLSGTPLSPAKKQTIACMERIFGDSFAGADPEQIDYPFLPSDFSASAEQSTFPR